MRHRPNVDYIGGLQRTSPASSVSVRGWFSACIDINLAVPRRCLDQSAVAAHLGQQITVQAESPLLVQGLRRRRIVPPYPGLHLPQYAVSSLHAGPWRITCITCPVVGSAGTYAHGAGRISPPCTSAARGTYRPPCPHLRSHPQYPSSPACRTMVAHTMSQWI
jgi:hypothetical protein